MSLTGANSVRLAARLPLRAAPRAACVETCPPIEKPAKWTRDGGMPSAAHSFVKISGASATIAACSAVPCDES
jgi:hypothetical protein